MSVLPEPNFPPIDGETPGARIARIVAAYAGCSLSNRRDDLAALVGRGVDDESVVTIESNCATFALGVLRAAGVAHPLLSEKYVDGMAFAWLEQIGNDLGAWRPGNQGPLPVGALLHYGISGENDDHAEFYLSSVGPSHGGGGRVNNAVTVETGPVALSMGRPIEQWMDPDALGIEVVEAAAGPTSEPHE